MKCRGDFTWLLSGHSVMKTYESFLPLRLLQAPSPDASYLVFALYLFLLLSPLAFVLLPLFSTFFRYEMLGVWVYLVDPNAVNLVIHNQYWPHLFPRDRNGPSDMYFLSFVYP